MKTPPISARLLRTLLSRICDKEGPNNSVSVADGVVEAHTYNHCVVIGTGDVDQRVCTDRDAALLEAERARIYKDWAKLEPDPIRGKPSGSIARVMRQLDPLPKAITVRPDLLIAAAQVAIAAGAPTVTLYAEHDSDEPLLGYTCEYDPTDEDGQYSFETEDTGPVPVRGLVAGWKEAPTPHDQPAPDMPDDVETQTCPELPLIIVSRDTEPEAFDVEIDGEHYGAVLTRRYLVEGEPMDNLNAVCEATGEFHNHLLLTSQTPEPGPELDAYIEKHVRRMYSA